MKRREFMTRAASGAGALRLGLKTLPDTVIPGVAAEHFSATDTVVLGHTGIHTSRLACGTGTVGFNHHSDQTALGIQGLSDLLVHGYERGLRFFDCADSYGSHPHVAAALKRVPREKVTEIGRAHV